MYKRHLKRRVKDYIFETEIQGKIEFLKQNITKFM